MKISLKLPLAKQNNAQATVADIFFRVYHGFVSILHDISDVLSQAHILHTSSFPRAKLFINLHTIFFYEKFFLHFALGKNVMKRKEVHEKKQKYHIL